MRTQGVRDFIDCAFGSFTNGVHRSFTSRVALRVTCNAEPLNDSINSITQHSVTNVVSIGVRSALRGA